MVLNKQDFYRFAEFELHPGQRALLRAGQKVTLAPKTFEVLTCLVQNAGRVVTKEELLKTIWPESFVEESNLTQHIFWLRKSLGDCATFIVTIPGRGYQFTPRVDILDEADPAAAPPVPEPSAPVNPAAPPQPSTQSPLLRGFLYAVAAVLAATAIAAVIAWRANRRVPGDHHEIVLAAFQNTTGDAAFDHALSTLLAIDLNQSPYLAVTGESDTRKVLQLMNRKPDEVLTTPLALEVCQRLNAQVVLTGAIANFGRKYLVTLSAANCQTGKPLAQAKATAGTHEDVLKAVDSVAADMRQQLGETLKSSAQSTVPLPLVPTYSLDALRAYSQGLDVYAHGKTQESIPFFQRAVDIDPMFAAAYLSMANSYGRMGEDNLSREAILKAYDLRNQGDELLRLQILSRYTCIVTGDLHANLENLKVWTASYPNQAQPWVETARVQSTLGHPELALEPGLRGVALAPNDGPAYSELVGVQVALGKIDDAKATCAEAIRRGIDGRSLHDHILEIAIFQHDDATIQREIRLRDGTDQQGTGTIYASLVAGKAHAAVASFLQWIDTQRKAGLPEHADGQARVLLHREVDYNMDTEISAQLAGMDQTFLPLNIVYADAELGRIPEAEAALRLYASTLGTATIPRYIYYPQAQAAVLLARHRPEEAIAALEASRPYDAFRPEPLLMRARAYLAARQLAYAEAAFHRLTDRPYISPAGAFILLAHLGLAETLELEGKHAAARNEYQIVFAAWKDADPDLRPLLRARAEYARIP